MIKPGSRILFIGPKTFGYEFEIKKELEIKGAQVDYFDDRPSSSPLIKALIRFRPELLVEYCNKYFTNIINKTSSYKYDYVFIIKGEAITVANLIKLKEIQPQAIFKYYTWDSLKNYKNSREKLEFFQSAFSFDSDDCLNNPRVKHLPLFYIKKYEHVNVVEEIKESYDILFLGSIHSDRYAVSQKIIKNALEANSKLRIYYHLYYQSKWVFRLQKILNSGFREIPINKVSWNSLSPDKTAELVCSSRISIDVHHPAQKGLTMRTIEVLGAGKKLITTNAEIRKYDFFSEKNILIVDRDNPIIVSTFLDSESEMVPVQIYEKYSLSNWLNEIFR